MDGGLTALGYSFDSRVMEEQWCAALGIFEQIEARTTLLLKQMAEADAA